MADSPLRSKRGFIQIKPHQLTPKRLDMSITLAPNELQRMLDQSQNQSRINPNTTFLGNAYNNTTANFVDSNSIVSERSLFDMQTDEQTTNTLFKEKTDMLFPQFLEILQGRTNESEVFETIQNLIHTCAGILEDSQKSFRRTEIDDKMRANAHWLEQELKTWKLLHALYHDRIMLQCDLERGMDCDDLSPLGASEKKVIAQLYINDANLREYQLIADWLEACYERRDNSPQVGHSSDNTMAWENTLFQLQNRKADVMFGSGVDIVKSMDPDAPIREKRPLHALDEEDDKRLSKCMFIEIRQGRIDEAMSLCKYCGQTWRAALLEGWRLHEDPNFEMLPQQQGGLHTKLSISGNPRRDIWKKCAWLMADSKKFDEYTRAIAGVFCGHLESLKTLLNDSWEDLLWAYLKVQIDIRVEEEIRSYCMKSYRSMPDAYWNSKISLEQTFEELAVHNDAAVRDYANSKVGIIQKYLILDNIDELLKHMENWVNAKSTSSAIKDSDSQLSPHLLRFLTHIVLFLRQIGRTRSNENIPDKIIAAYVKQLITMGDSQLVAFYTAALPGKTQVELYSQFLETIPSDSKIPTRYEAIKEAKNAGLDIENITRHCVESIRQRMPSDNTESQAALQVGDISAFDEQKISALEWLAFLPTQRGELIWQANAMIRLFLGEGKAECVRATYNMVPADSISQVIQAYGSKDNLPCREECSIKEYLCYKVYLAANDNFNEWSTLFHSRPKEPPHLSETANANFTERIASEHKEQAYRAELSRWTASLKEQTEITLDALYNIIVFPEKGWLIDPDTSVDNETVSLEDWHNRQVQLDRLRSICLPEITLLLREVLHQSGDYKSCVKLADDIACESRQLYKVFTKHKMAELLAKVAESSLALLNQKLDPWGFPATI